MINDQSNDMTGQARPGQAYDFSHLPFPIVLMINVIVDEAGKTPPYKSQPGWKRLVHNMHPSLLFLSLRGDAGPVLHAPRSACLALLVQNHSMAYSGDSKA